GHDSIKVYAAYKAAVEHTGSPTVILAKTVKGWALGEGFLGKMATHQIKKMNLDQLRSFRDRLELPISDAELEHAPYYNPGPASEDIRSMLDRRPPAGASLRKRVLRAQPPPAPAPSAFDELKTGTAGSRPVSTTMAFVRLLRNLLRDRGVGNRIVPIIPDEA